jgi:hypothetical protein
MRNSIFIAVILTGCVPLIVYIVKKCKTTITRAATPPCANKNRYRPHTNVYSPPTDYFCESPTFEQHVIEMNRLKHARWLYQTGRITEFPDNHEIEV